MNSEQLNTLYSEEAEAAVLGAIFINPTALPEIIPRLKPDGLYILRHRHIYSAMLRLFDRNEGIDILTVSEELKSMGALEEAGGRAQLIYLHNETPTSLNVLAHAEVVNRYAIRRKILAVMNETSKLMLDEHYDSKDALALAQQVINEGFQMLNAGKLRTQHEVVSAVYDRVDALQSAKDGTTLLLPSGLYDLDKKLGGGLRGLIVVAGPSGGGKTTLMYQIGVNVADKGGKVMVISREMDDEELVERLITQKSLLSTSDQRRKLVPAEWQRFVNATGKIADLPIWYDCESSTMTEIVASVKQIHQAYGLDLVIIDYAQIIDPSDAPASNREQEVAYVSRKCKQLQRDLGIPVLLGSQLNEKGEVRESRAIKNDSDVLLKIDTAEDETNNLKGKRRILIDKNRHGAAGQRVQGGAVWLYYNPDQCYFGNLA